MTKVTPLDAKLARTNEELLVSGFSSRIAIVEEARVLFNIYHFFICLNVSTTAGTVKFLSISNKKINCPGNARHIIVNSKYITIEVRFASGTQT